MFHSSERSSSYFEYHLILLRLLQIKEGKGAPLPPVLVVSHACLM